MTTNILIDNISTTIFGIARFNQAFLKGQVGYRDYAEVEDQLKVRQDAIFLLDIAFRTTNDGDLETLKAVNDMASNLVDRYEITNIALEQVKFDKEQKTFEKFITKHENEVLELLHNMVTKMRFLHETEEREFFRENHLDKLINLYSILENIAITIKKGNDESVFDIFDKFLFDFYEIEELLH